MTSVRVSTSYYFGYADAKAGFDHATNAAGAPLSGDYAKGYLVGQNDPKQMRNVVAYHEAGHAVAARVLSIPFKYVTIKPNDSSSGHLEEVAGCRITRTSDFKRAVMSFAGPLAEIEFYGEVDPRDDPGYVKHTRRCTHGGDFAEINFRVRGAVGFIKTDPRKRPPTYRSLRARCKREALALVREHKADIKRVAKALLKHETLTSKQVRNLVARDAP